MKSVNDAAQDTLRRLQSIPISVLWILNLVLGVFVAAANGLALVLTLRGIDPTFHDRAGQMAVLAIGGALLALLSLVGYFRGRATEAILRLQSVILLGVVVCVLFLGIETALHPNVAAKTVWQIGLFTILGAYSGYLITRSFLTAQSLSRQGALWLAWIAGLLVFDIWIGARVGM